MAGSYPATINRTTTILRAAAAAKYAAGPWAGRPIGLQLLTESLRYSDFDGGIEYSARIQLAGAVPTHVCDFRAYFAAKARLLTLPGT